MLFAQKRGLARLIFIWKWITSTLSFIWLETNANVSSLWNPFFQWVCLLVGEFFLRSRFQVRLRFLDNSYNFHNFHGVVKYEEFYESSYVGEIHANCSISKTRDFLCARNWKFVRTMQHMQTVEKPQEFLVLTIQLLGEYVRQHHSKKPTQGDSVVSKEVSMSNETKKEQESLDIIR